MTNPTPEPGAIAVALQLTRAVNGLGTQLAKVNEASEERDARIAKDGRRTRWLVIGAIVSLLIDLPLTGLYIANNLELDRTTAQLRMVTAELQHTRATVTQLHQANVNSCRTGNAYRAGQIVTWTHLAGITRPPPGTPPAKARKSERAISGFLAFIREQNKPRDCSAIYRLPGGSPPGPAQATAPGRPLPPAAPASNTRERP